MHTVGILVLSLHRESTNSVIISITRSSEYSMYWYIHPGTYASRIQQHFAPCSECVAMETVHYRLHGDCEVYVVVSWQPNIRNACSLYTESPDSVLFLSLKEQVFSFIFAST